jgi:hypothetical protein
MEVETESDRDDQGHIRVVDSDIGQDQPNEDQVLPHLNRGSRVASGNLAVLETNKAPMLRTADRKDILQFQQKREKYIRVHYEAGLDSTRMWSLVSMIEPVFLEAICQYFLGSSIIEVTDRQLEDWMSSILRDDKSRDVLLDKKMGQMRMRMSIESAGARVLDLIVQFHRIVKENGWERLFEDLEGKKRQIKFLLSAVEPKGLRSMMGDRVQREAHLSKDPTAFIKLLQEVAVYYQETSMYQGTDSGGSQKGNKRQRPDFVEDKREGRKTPNVEKGSDSRNYKKQAKLRCFHCKEVGHPVYKCPKNLSKDQVHEALEKNKKPKKDSKYSLVCQIGVEEYGNEVLVKINQSMYFPAILDSGAIGVSLIPRSIAQKAVLNDPSITLQRLPEPVRLRLGDKETELMATDFVCVNLRLRTKAGELITRNRQCLIWDVPSDEIILGSDLLEELGVEPKTALDALILRTKEVCRVLEDEENGNHEEDSQDLILVMDTKDIEEGINAMLLTARKNGLPEEWSRKLSRLVRKYADVWRSNLGPDPPAKVTPFVTRLLPNARPYRCKSRRYSPEDSQFLKEFTDDLVKNGLIEENVNSEWASPVVVVRKSDGGKRMVVDLRAVNAVCESTAWPMPFLEAVVNNLAGSRCWFKLDAFKGFWMMPLAEDCQEMFSFMTDRGVFTPRRSIQGALNSATQFQARMAEVFKGLINKSLIIWIDDLLGYADSLETWYRTLETTLKCAEEHNIKLNLRKCELFTSRVKFCGRIFTTEGVQHDPDRIDALQSIPQPRTARDLQQFLMAAQWMSRSIPEYNKRVQCLQDIFEQCMRSQPSRKKSVARQVRLSKFGWAPGHALAFEQLKMAIASCVRLAYPRKDMLQCMFTDASDDCASGMVTQIPIEDEEKSIQFQRHEPLGFVGHRFNETERNWSVAEKGVLQ